MLILKFAYHRDYEYKQPTAPLSLENVLALIYRVVTVLSLRCCTRRQQHRTVPPPGELDETTLFLILTHSLHVMS